MDGDADTAATRSSLGAAAHADDQGDDADAPVQAVVSESLTVGTCVDTNPDAREWRDRVNGIGLYVLASGKRPRAP
jgi:hypothetical protein